MLLYVVFAQSWQYRDRRKPGDGTTPYSYRMTSRVFYSAQYDRQSLDSTANSKPLNSLERCICTTPVTNIRPGRDSNPVPRVSSHNRIESAVGSGRFVSRKHMLFGCTQTQVIGSYQGQSRRRTNLITVVVEYCLASLVCTNGHLDGIVIR